MSIDLREGLRRLRASSGARGDDAASRLERRCEIVERYDIAHEPRNAICASLRISERTFYFERHKLLAEIAKLDRRDRAPAPASAEVSLAAARFRATDLLYQVNALGEAAARLAEIARTARDENVKVSALSRLVEVEGDAHRIEAAVAALRSAHECARLTERELSSRAQAELFAAEARCAVLLHETRQLERAAGELELLATQVQHDPHLWSLAGRTRWRMSTYRFGGLDIAAAAQMYDLSVAAFARAGDARPIDRVRLLSFRALLDIYDPARAHFARSENARAFALAIEHGIVESATQAIYNTLGFSVYCDETLLPAGDTTFAAAIASSADALAASTNDARLASLAAAARGDFGNAVLLLDAAIAEHPPGTYERLVLVNFQARVLFKARRFGEAARVARAAALEWEGSGLHGEGAALRILAETLEALGERRAAMAAASESLALLQRHSPVHHLLAAYRCIHRLSPRRAYRERIDELSEFTRQIQPDARILVGEMERSRDAPAARLTPREREIATLIAEGRTNAAISHALGISPKTVANHVAAIFERLGLRARWQLTREMVAR